MVASQKGMAFFLACFLLLLGGCLNQYGEKQTSVPSIIPATSPPPDFTPSPTPSTTPPPIIRQGTLTVTCDMGGYGLFVDDGFMLTDEGDGTTFLTLREGTHTVLLSKIGCTSVSTLVNIRGETNTQVAFTMSCEAPSPTTSPPMPPPTLPPMNPATSPPPTPLVPTTPPTVTYPPPPPPSPVTIIPPIPPPVTTLPPPPTSLPTPTPPPTTTYPPPTPTPSVTYSFSNLGLQNVVLDASVQGQNLLSVPFGVPFAKSNGKVVVNVQGNNPAYLRLWVNGIEVQKGTLLPIYVEFVIPTGVLFGGSNTLVIGWGMGSFPTPSTITILNTSYITVIKTGICISL